MKPFRAFEQICQSLLLKCFCTIIVHGRGVGNFFGEKREILR